MLNNDLLRRLRYALNVTDIKVVELFQLAGYRVQQAELENMFKREGEAGYAECGDLVVQRFLEGLIIVRRGRREEKSESKGRREGAGQAPSPGHRLSNNEILKLLRIALELKDEDIIDIMGLAGVEVSKSELTALFRKRGHPNYRPCGDQFLRNFLVGLTAKYRV